MAFKTEIANLLSTDVSILYYLDSSANISYSSAPQNFDKNDNYITWGTEINDTFLTLDNKEIDTYDLAIVVHTGSSVTTENIAKEVQRTLNNYKSTKILNIIFNNEQEVFNADNNMYMILSNFQGVYQK